MAEAMEVAWPESSRINISIGGFNWIEEDELESLLHCSERTLVN